MDRRAKILEGIDQSMRVLELGPGYSPLTPRSQGWNVCTVDHATRVELVAKYESEPDVDVSRIEEVDVVWAGGSLHDAVPLSEHGTFDVCIASHVLEHVPDPISLFQSFDRLLKEDGRVSLAIPDKRFCFDFFKPLTSTGDLLEAHAEQHARHSLKHQFEQIAYSISSASRICWERGSISSVAFLRTLEDARGAYDNYEREAPYVDCHAWYFTPSSFELAILELHTIDVLPFTITRRPSPEGCEFYVTLERVADAENDDDISTRRLELLTQTLVELGEQAAFVADTTEQPHRRRWERRLAAHARARLRR